MKRKLIDEFLNKVECPWGMNRAELEQFQSEVKQLKSEQNKVAVEKLEELRARFDNSPIIFFHDTELNEKERAIVRDEYENAKFIFRDNIDQLLAELKGERECLIKNK